ncbi:MAG: response regulator [Myxococcales bacterium]|nr:response regulator [Myxococcales bacterium]
MTSVGTSATCEIGRPKILVVDDDPAARVMLSDLLAGEGYAVTATSDGLTALTVVERAVPDIIISDVSMPGMDGFELVRELRARAASAEVPILLLSAIAQSARRVTGLDLGADDFVAKPVDLDELLARIRALLRRARQREEIERRATLDLLTGVLNRAGLDAALHREQQHALRTGEALSILMIDLDRFKTLNDEHGHLAGDRALRCVCGRAARGRAGAVTTSDALWRRRVPDHPTPPPPPPPPRLAARLRSVRMPAISVGAEGEIVVQISIGEATMTPDDTIESLVERADRAMYRIKRTSQAPATIPA